MDVPADGDTAPGIPPVLRVAAGQDRFGEHRALSINSIDFKVTTQDSENLFIAEVTFHAKGGPPRHLQYEQDEWFYVLEGEFIFEVGFEGSVERRRLTAGDSLLAPLRVPHVWAFVGEGVGRILTVCMPAGKVEAFFREISKVNAPPASDPEVWRAYGMEYLGPPLLIAP
jgi:mannose-6-phosphate isomerase-like protein (cupin superfamily)